MLTTLIVFSFLVGYIAITAEHSIRVNKAATALVTGVLCWTLYVFTQSDVHIVSHQLAQHVGEISGILFFLMGAMAIVELIDAHDGFDIITFRITTRNKRKLIWLFSGITFILSAILDNLTTTIVMVSLVKKIFPSGNTRLLFASIVVIAANAGGVWSPIGDVTTTMLWIGGQITSLSTITHLIVPSIICTVIPASLISLRMKGMVEEMPVEKKELLSSSPRERNLVFGIGLTSLILVPVFKSVTHLPPYMGILGALGVMWVCTEIIHHQKDERDKDRFSVLYALRKIDMPSILFFLGILLAIGALQLTGTLTTTAQWLDQHIGNINLVIITIGCLSAIVDNVPLVAAAMSMYDMQLYPTDHYFWQFLAYSAGTGGSMLIIGSAAGVAAMGLEKISFFWYLKNISLLALAGFLAGAGAYILQMMLIR